MMSHNPNPPRVFPKQLNVFRCCIIWEQSGNLHMSFCQKSCGHVRGHESLMVCEGGGGVVSCTLATLLSFLTTMQFNQLPLIKLSNCDENREQREHLLYTDIHLL